MGVETINGRLDLHTAVWLQVNVHRLSLDCIAYRLYAHCLWHKSAAAAAVIGSWHSISVICLCL